MSDKWDEMAHQMLDLAHEQENPMVWGYEWECDSSILAVALRSAYEQGRADGGEQALVWASYMAAPDSERVRSKIAEEIERIRARSDAGNG